MEQILSIVVRNQPGVLMRVAGMFSRRGFNIDSLAVGITQNPEFSRMTVTMQADDATIKQVCKQLAKLVEVEAVKVLPPKASANAVWSWSRCTPVINGSSCCGWQMFSGPTLSM